MPYYSALDTVPGTYWGEIDSHVSMYYDRVPKGEVEVRRASAVISADGHSDESRAEPEGTQSRRRRRARDTSAVRFCALIGTC